MKGLLLLITLLVFSTASAQIVVDQAGDDWKSRVDSALLKIQQTDSATWKFVTDYVSHISFWNGAFSTTEIDNHGKWAVVISASDIRLNSVNNIACVIVHESYHIYSAQHHPHKTVCEEELAAYTFEQAFQAKIPNLESWIDISTVHWLELYKDRVKSKDCN
jgi:hypothetical protein